MTDISVIILVGKEELHIRRCLEKLAPLEPRQIFVVESQKGDRTHEIALEMGATTVWHDWPGLHAKQFNWALDNLPIQTRWVLRLDADEYLTLETIERLCGAQGLRALPDDVTGLTLELKRRFCGGEIRHATNGIRLLRIWRFGHGRSEERAMDIMRDERLEVHLAAKPRHFKTTRLLTQRIAYYVGDVNRTRPAFVGRSDAFTIDHVADLILQSALLPTP